MQREMQRERNGEKMNSIKKEKKTFGDDICAWFSCSNSGVLLLSFYHLISLIIIIIIMKLLFCFFGATEKNPRNREEEGRKGVQI